MAYVHPTEWSDDRLTLYPQLSSTPRSRAGPQTPYGVSSVPPPMSGRSQYPLPSSDLPRGTGTLQGSSVQVQGYNNSRPAPEHMYLYPGHSSRQQQRERSLDHGNVFRGGRSAPEPASVHARGVGVGAGGGPHTAGLSLSAASGNTSCESSYLSNDSFESACRPTTASLISKRGIPSISSGIPTMGTSTMNGGRYLPSSAGGAEAGRYTAAAGGAHFLPGVTGLEKVSHAGCGKEVAMRLKQSSLAATCRNMVDRGCGRRRSALLLCLLLFCIGLLVGAISVVLYLTGKMGLYTSQ